MIFCLSTFVAACQLPKELQWEQNHFCCCRYGLPASRWIYPPSQDRVRFTRDGQRQSPGVLPQQAEIFSQCEGWQGPWRAEPMVLKLCSKVPKGSSRVPGVTGWGLGRKCWVDGAVGYSPHFHQAVLLCASKLHAHFP